MNIVEIDLDNYFVTQVPTGQKENLAHVTAIMNGWTPTITTLEKKEYLGTSLELDVFIVNKPDNIRILNRLSDKILYEESITVDNPTPSFDYGLKFMQSYMGAKSRKDMKEFNTTVLKESQEQVLKDAEQTIQDDLDIAFEDMVVL